MTIRRGRGIGSLTYTGKNLLCISIEALDGNRVKKQTKGEDRVRSRELNKIW